MYVSGKATIYSKDTSNFDSSCFKRFNVSIGSLRSLLEFKCAGSMFKEGWLFNLSSLRGDNLTLGFLTFISIGSRISKLILSAILAFLG